jgi:putative methionine-R-sulfoxide reductase with GAF domain
MVIEELGRIVEDAFGEVEQVSDFFWLHDGESYRQILQLETGWSLSQTGVLLNTFLRLISQQQRCYTNAISPLYEARMDEKKAPIVDLVGRIASSSQDKGKAARLIAAAIRDGFGYRWTGIYEVGNQDIYALAWDGPHAPAWPRFPKTKGLSGRAILSRAAVNVDDVTQDPDYLTTVDSTRSEIVVPVLGTTMEAVGLIDAESERVAAFSAEDLSALQACAAAIRPLWSE